MSANTKEYLRGLMEDIGRTLADDDFEDVMLAEIRERMPDVLVYPALRGQVYGGSEEGGWYYDAWTPLTSDRYEDGHKAQEMPLHEAIKYCRRANALANELINSKRPGYSDTNSTGVVEWVWTWEKVPTYEPQERPRYE